MKIRHRACALALCACLLCASLLMPVSCAESGKRSERDFTCFDTVCEISAWGEREADFRARCDLAFGILRSYHREFDIYHEYEGMNNLATVNKNAGSPVAVSDALFDFLCYAKDVCERTGGRLNVTMGSVLSLWHDAREAQEPTPPQSDTLAVAGEHVSLDALVFDDLAKTVCLTDPLASLDVGGIGKGYAAEAARRALAQDGASGYILNVGGNVCVLGEKTRGEGFLVGIRDPAGTADYKHTFRMSDACLSTSGDYERAFVFEGVRYHHIIDPDTLCPAAYYASVSVLGEDSALTDALSTALFTLPPERAMALLSAFDGYEAYFIFPDGSVTRSAAFPQG